MACSLPQSADSESETNLTHHSDTLLTKSPNLEKRSLPAFASGGLDPEAIRYALLLVLVSWLLVASAYSGAVSPASGITGLDFDVFYQAASRLNAGQLLYTSRISLPACTWGHTPIPHFWR